MLDTGVTTNNRKTFFRPDLQGLRAIAIVLVVLSHADMPFLQGGFVGVDVFFVLSGYLITGLLQRELEQTGNIKFSNFYTRRLKRLLPALIVMLCVTFSAAVWLLSPTEAREQLASAPYAAAWISNFYFMFASVDYFNELAANDLFLHTWSLGVEEQFYLLWPVLLLGIFYLSTANRLAKSRKYDLTFFGLIFLLIVSFIISIHWTYTQPKFGYYQMPSRIWQFALGSLVQVASNGERSRALRQRFLDISPYIPLFAGIALIVVSGIGLNSNVQYPGFWAILPSLGAALVIAAGQGLVVGRNNPLSHSIMVWIGNRSYSWYLWHWPILALGFSLGFRGNALATLGLVLLSLLISMFSYRFVERPIWKGKWSHFPAQETLLAGLIVALAAVFVTRIELRQLPTADRASRWRSDVPAIYSSNCDTFYLSDQVVRCTVGQNSAPKTVVLLGDSIMGQWFSMVPSIFKAPKWRTIVFTKSACPMIDEYYFYKRAEQIYYVCSRWRKSVLDELDKIKPDVIIVGNSTTYNFNENAWIEGSTRIIQRLSKAARHVVVFLGTPSLSFDGPSCVDRHMSRDGHIDRNNCLSEDRVKLVQPVAQYLRQAVSHFSNVNLLDLSELVCPHGNCYATSGDGLIVFRDSQHLTDSFVRSLVPLIRTQIDPLVRD